MMDVHIVFKAARKKHEDLGKVLSHIENYLRRKGYMVVKVYGEELKL